MDEDKDKQDQEKGKFAEQTVADWEAMVSKDEKKEDAAKEGASEEDMMAQWEAMSSGDEAPKTLNQNEIDALLGVASQKNDHPNRGIRALIESAMKSYQKLPMLEVVFDRYTRLVSTNLRSLTSENVDVDVRNISSLRFSDYINAVAMPALLGIFRVIEWDNFGMVNISGDLVYALLDVLFGGRKVIKATRFNGKPYTNIEQNVVRQFCDLLLNDLGIAFEPLSPSTFLFERLETNPRFATIARPGDAVILIELDINIEDKGGKLEILLPYATLEPIRELLTQVFLGEKFGKDSTWEHHISKELMNTTITLDAVLAEKETKFENILKLDIGHTIILDCAPGDDVILSCANIKLFAGKLGSFEDNIAVSVERPVHKKLVEMME
ncbi:MAG: flagellar motor switch protein FliM [Alphaproteobacteria bacterium 33-17]|nr:MAG: flagellar motor switch protein FliM [Alphaproteobacteria bacterium 33-17]